MSFYELRREGGRRRGAGAGAGAQEDRRAFRLWKTEERCGGDYDGLAPEIIIMISILLPVSLSHTTPGVAPPGHPGISRFSPLILVPNKFRNLQAH